MNNEQQSGGGAALPPPTPGSQTGFTLPVYSAPAPRRRRKAGPIIGAVVGAAALVGGGIVAVGALSGDDGGAGSPEAAVQALFDAAGNEDVLGVLDTLLPGERRSFEQPLRDLVDELKRLEILSGAADLGAVQGVDLEFRDLDLHSAEVADGIAVVDVTGGVVSSKADLAELPIGDLLLELGFGGERPEGEVQSEEEIVSSEDSPIQIATVRDGGRWYVSVWFSVAEAARRAADAPAPDPSAAVEAPGSESPEAVLEDLLAALGGVDLEEMIGLLPPGEARALHVYAPLFLEDAQAQVDDAIEEGGFSLTVENVSYDVERDGDHATVVPTGLALTAEAGGESVEVEFDGECATVTIDGDEQRFCTDDVAEQMEDLGLSSFAGLGSITPGFEVVQDDGRWYLSPTATMTRPLVAVLEELEQDEIRDLVEAFEDGFAFDAESFIP